MWDPPIMSSLLVGVVIANVRHTPACLVCSVLRDEGNSCHVLLGVLPPSTLTWRAISNMVTPVCTCKEGP